MRIKRHYDDEFIKNSVELVNTTKKSITQIAKSLGIPVSTLRQWVGVYKREDMPEKKRVRVHQLSDIEKDNLRLQKEVADLKMERDILKKAAAILLKNQE